MAEHSSATANERESTFNIGVITGGSNVPSRRFRVLSLVPYLEKRGIKITEFCPLVSTYPPRAWWLRPAWLLAALGERLTYTVRARGFDAIVLQRELISTLPTIERLIPGPRILDVDDAIFLHRRGLAAKNAAACAVGVVCGNRFLADHFSRWNDNVAVIPTGIDTDRLKPRSDYGRVSSKIVGWIGTSGNMKYLYPVAKPIRNAVTSVPGAELHIISDSPVNLPPELRTVAKFIRWQPDIELESLPHWSVGLMPLTSNEWERGKCAFKLLQYLAAGVPAVASPVGMNAEVLGASEVGIAPTTAAQWEDAIRFLLENESVGKALGSNGRRLVEERYSLDVVSQSWKAVLNKWLRGL